MKLPEQDSGNMDINKIIISSLSSLEGKVDDLAKKYAGVEQILIHHADTIKVLADSQKSSADSMTEMRILFENMKSKWESAGENTQMIRTEMAGIKKHCEDQHDEKNDTLKSLKSLWPVLFPLIAFLIWLWTGGKVNLFSGTD